MGEGSSAAEPVPREVCVPEMVAAEMPPPKMAVHKMSATEVSAEVPSPEMAVRKMPATEMTAVEAAKMTESSEVTATKMHPSEVTAAKAPEMTSAKVTTAKVTAAAEPTVAKGRGFAHRARHYARRERNCESETERDHRCENFCHPTRHDARLLPPLRTSDLRSDACGANA
jgi:hypothetical protein